MASIVPPTPPQSPTPPDPPFNDVLLNQTAKRYCSFLELYDCTLPGSTRERQIGGFYNDIVQTPLLYSKVSKVVLSSFPEDNLYLEIEIDDSIGSKLDRGDKKYLRLQVKYDNHSFASSRYIVEVIFQPTSSFEPHRHHQLARGDLAGVYMCHVLDLAKITWTLYGKANGGNEHGNSKQAGHFPLILAFVLRSMCRSWTVLDHPRLNSLREAPPLPPQPRDDVNAQRADSESERRKHERNWENAWGKIDPLALEVVREYMKRWDGSASPRDWDTFDLELWASLQVRSLRSVPKLKERPAAASDSTLGQNMAHNDHDEENVTVETAFSPWILSGNSRPASIFQHKTMSLDSFFASMFGDDVDQTCAESFATITSVVRYVDNNSWVNHELVVVEAQLDGRKFLVRVDRSRGQGGTNHLALKWKAMDTVHIFTGTRLDPALDREILKLHSRVDFRDIDNIRSKPKLRDLALLMRYMHDDFPKYFLHAQNCWWVATMVQISLRALFGGEWVRDKKPGLDWVTAKELRKTVDKCEKFYHEPSVKLDYDYLGKLPAMEVEEVMACREDTFTNDVNQNPVVIPESTTWLDRMRDRAVEPGRMSKRRARIIARILLTPPIKLSKALFAPLRALLPKRPAAAA